MLYIIGLGLNIKSISLEGLETIKKCKKVYLESYTVEFPYSVEELRKVVGKDVVSLGREDVESNRLVKEARREDIALLIYGSPLFATTHIGLLEDCKKARVKVKVIYSASIFDALGETGLQLYKFGKISSMPKWQEHFKPDSFLEFVEENQKINAHSLILIDIGLEFKDAIEQLITASNNRKIKINKLLVCSQLGTEKGSIHYNLINKLKKLKVKAPFCFIIPGKMHFMEAGVVEGFGFLI